MMATVLDAINSLLNMWKLNIKSTQKLFHMKTWNSSRWNKFSKSPISVTDKVIVELLILIGQLVELSSIHLLKCFLPRRLVMDGVWQMLMWAIFRREKYLMATNSEILRKWIMRCITRNFIWKYNYYLLETKLPCHGQYSVEVREVIEMFYQLSMANDKISCVLRILWRSGVNFGCCYLSLPKEIWHEVKADQCDTGANEWKSKHPMLNGVPVILPFISNLLEFWSFHIPKNALLISGCFVLDVLDVYTVGLFYIHFDNQWFEIVNILLVYWVCMRFW